MGGALGLRAARCEPFGRGLSGAAREQPATVRVSPARTVDGVLWGPRGAGTANGRRVRPLGSGTRLEPSSADRPHLGWAYLVVAVWLPTPRRAYSVGCGVENGNITHASELDRFDSESSVQAYKPQAMLAQLAAETSSPPSATTFDSGRRPTERNPEYAVKLRAVSRKVGLPAEYIAIVSVVLRWRYRILDRAGSVLRAHFCGTVP